MLPQRRAAAGMLLQPPRYKHTVLSRVLEILIEDFSCNVCGSQTAGKLTDLNQGKRQAGEHALPGRIVPACGWRHCQCSSGVGWKGGSGSV
jgi:hypothetical protein